ncbi:ParB-like nuclease domain-containing protein [Pantoea agglomerans]|uniref:ParB-like nuclease domain-containing protein n=1 Tax=Enterobacter agglomerans TaxID=549 RepID=A0ACC5PVQ8_ENTAG|nr:ParB/RepB/Spo0J family partition protein [Pantoea agglomerans]MBD8129094.1 ParB-like nuclease domain-containing protein [Pantoea agglomerans]MBD8156406.1 ParB-like nuclease domain-containing protein [Pantoea agglomerans]MBD8161171.1 ParB-like nuclease domain-containing protein [Pantoea agglomerans]MBD8234798.1 ParB-like nuclease domain-containing protein [Pantoea agglomerans]MBD8245202.1 ParB-like nuclease domain-containing protein [Pantoea agglomerans]
MSRDMTKTVIEYLESFDDVELKINAINELKSLIHQHSPFCCEPVDCVLWVKAKTVEANDYNPNMMATVEKKLLERSIKQDGFTQPVVVANQQQRYLVVDGFHRHLIGKSCPELNQRLRGYLPVALINAECEGQKERIAATIRHNRARGKHQIAAMSDIVRDLHRQGWDDSRIGEELGMDADEVLRLKQISGLTELFADKRFSEAWTVA